MTRTKNISVTPEELKKYPRIYEMYISSPKVSMAFLVDMVQRLWAGDKEEALEMIESFLGKKR